jgi:hypothetical protein
LSEHCEKLPDDKRKEVCNLIVPAKVPEIVKLIEEKKRADFICEGLGFARGFGAGRDVFRPDCEEIVAAIKKDELESADHANHSENGTLTGSSGQLLEEQKPDEKNPGGPVVPGQVKKFGLRRFLPDILRQKFTRSCRDFPREKKSLCHLISRLINRRFPEELRNSSAGEICTKLDQQKFLKLTDVKPIQPYGHFGVPPPHPPKPHDGNPPEAKPNDPAKDDKGKEEPKPDRPKVESVKPANPADGVPKPEEPKPAVPPAAA